jgi:PAS domain-containing protein
MRQEFRLSVGQFIWAIVAVAAALGATELLYMVDRPVREHGAFAFFLAAVVIAAWRGGLFSALVTLIASSLIVAWLLPPPHSFRVNGEENVTRLVLFIGLGLLITYLYNARRSAERSLQESERRLHMSLDSAGVACWDANVKTGTFWKSHNLADVFGRSQSDFATTYEGFFAYIHPEDREFFHLASIGGGPNQRDYEIAHRILWPDGTTRKVNTRGRMYIGEDGRVERMVGAVFSIDDKSKTPGPTHPMRAGVKEIASQFLI